MAYILLNIVDDCAVPGRVCLYLESVKKEDVRGLLQGTKNANGK